MQSQKGSMTLYMAMVMLVLVALMLVLIDLSRVTRAKSHINLAFEHALDAALVQYDQTFYDAFHIMVLMANEDRLGDVEAWVKKGLKMSNKGLAYLPMQLERLTLEPQAYLTDVGVLKKQIITAHRTVFIEEKLNAWMTQMEHMTQLFHMGQVLGHFSEVFDIIGTLQDTANAAIRAYEGLEDLIMTLKNLEIDDMITSYERHLSEKKALEAAIKDLQTQIANLSHDTVSDNSDMIKRLSLEKKDLLKTLEKHQALLSEDLKVIDGVILGVEKINQTNQTFYALSKALTEANEKIATLNQAILDATSESTRYKDVYAYISTLQNQMDQTLTQVNTFTQAVTDQTEGLLKTLNRIKAAHDLSRQEMTRLVSGLKTIETWIKRPKLNVFEPQSTRTESVRLKDVLLFFVKYTKEGLYKALPVENDKIEEDVYHTLPSVQRGITHEVLDERQQKNGAINNQWARLHKSTISHAKVQENLFKDLGLWFEERLDQALVADYTLTYFKSHVDEKENNEFHAEVEYILFGRQDSLENVMLANLQIYGIRFVSNACSLLVYKQNKLQEVALKLSTASSGLGYPLIYAGLVAGWSGLESYDDCKHLLSGERVLLFKQNDDWTFDVSWSSLKQWLSKERAVLLPDSSFEGSLKSTQTGQQSLQVWLDYEAYLMSFLWVTPEEKTLLRILDMMVLRGHRQGWEADLMQAHFAFMAEADFKVPYAFIGSDILEKTIGSWPKREMINLKQFRGY